MKNNKSRIDTYSTPYDIDIVVANKYVTVEDLRELYIRADNPELDENLFKDCMAITVGVTRKSDNARCILVKYCNDNDVKNIDKLLDIVNTADHEATHVLMDIYNIIRGTIDMENQEVFAYLHAHITCLILKTWMNR